MFEIIEKIELAEDTNLIELSAPDIAENALPGQFVIIVAEEKGERIPLTITDRNTEKGTITVVYKILGRSTADLGRMEKGTSLFNVAGPLGKPSEIRRFGTVAVVGGGIGIALIYPVAKALSRCGNRVITVIGAQNEKLLILRDRIASVSAELLIATDDGSAGRKGFVTELLEDRIKKEKIDMVFAVGPVVMMKAAAAVTKKYGIKTIVSLNPIMVDGTGMCGACRVEVGGKTKFACVDGPDFDAHEVNFELLAQRQKIYRKQEKKACGDCQCR
ncbi:MAG: sulfide/dihydroorotate dehydrogenase-like FAD/NAD-binding protein [Elusimicrobia bacterium]|nr:sulfide/dihydroorotate dehydrogenase-like FAD/NAD-binding protein [Elusimicrobiota bacterium]